MRFFRSLMFMIAYLSISIAYVIMGVLASLFPGKFAATYIVRKYAHRMVTAMRVFAGIRIRYLGDYAMPSGPVIIAPKHQSWGDGFCSFAFKKDLVFVAGNHLEKIPLLKGLMKKIGAIVVDNCGGSKAGLDLMAGAEKAFAEGRSILIYPEGHLSSPGTHHRYRAGVWRLYSTHNVPVVPAATNLGLFWEKTAFMKTPGIATVQYLEAIQPGLSRGEFMSVLEQRIEDATRKLNMEVTGRDPGPSVEVKFAKEEERKNGTAGKVQ